MGTVAGTGVAYAKGVHKKTWTSLAGADSGSPLDAPHMPDKTVQVIGTAWDGATLVIEGSNDGGTTWTTLNDVEGNALSWTVGASHLAAIQENPLLIRPSTTGGDDTTGTDLTVIITSRSANR
jgi:hypothetical protein